jgi:hypothetical protein
MASRSWSQDELDNIHQKVVESGLFDSIQQADYIVGDMVAIRFNDTAHHICEIRGESLLVDNGTTQQEINKNDVRPVNGYVRMVSQIIHPDKEMGTDRNGRGYTIHYENHD